MIKAHIKTAMAVRFGQNITWLYNNSACELGITPLTISCYYDVQNLLNI